MTTEEIFELSLVPRPFSSDASKLNHSIAKLCNEINELLPHLTSKEVKLTKDQLAALLNQDFFYLVICREISTGRLVGMASIYLVHTVLAKKCHIADVVVHPDFQRMRLGRQINEYLLSLAKRFCQTGVDYKYCHVELTSNPRRVSANALYEKLGYKKQNTNFYRFDIRWK